MAFLLGLLGASCPPGPADPADEEVPVDPPEVALLEVVPARVYVRANASQFQLRARLRDEQGYMISETWGLGSQLDWSWDPESAEEPWVDPGSGGNLAKPMGHYHSAWVETPDVPADQVTDLIIAVTLGDLKSEVEVLLLPEEDDRFVNEPRVFTTGPPDLPALALFAGDIDPDGGSQDCVVDSWDRPTAVVGHGRVAGNLKNDCTSPEAVQSSIAFLSPGKEMAVAAVGWTGGQGDVVNFRASTTPGDVYRRDLGAPLNLTMTVWVPLGAKPRFSVSGMLDDQVVEQQVWDEIAFADSVFARSLLGVRVDVAGGQLKRAHLDALETDPLPWDCAEVPDRLSDVPDTAFGPDKFNIFFILDLFKLDAQNEPEDAGYHGLACLPDLGSGSDNGAIVLIEWPGHRPSTLAHELGHMMALNDPPLPWAGHTRYIGGLWKMDNLMWVGSDYPRDYLSVGQAVRMNVDERSWLNRAGIRTTAQGEFTALCQCDPYKNMPRDGSLSPQKNNWCPKLWIDIANASEDTTPPYIQYDCP